MLLGPIFDLLFDIYRLGSLNYGFNHILERLFYKNCNGMCPIFVGYDVYFLRKLHFKNVHSLLQTGKYNDSALCYGVIIIHEKEDYNSALPDAKLS